MNGRIDFERARIPTVADVEPSYPIERAAALTGVSAHTLRYYERIGLLAPVGRASSGHRRYTDTDLGSVRFLTLLRETGMPIRDMQRFVALARNGEGTVPQRLAVLEAHRDALRARLEQLSGHLAALDHKVEVYSLIAAQQALDHDGMREQRV
jgi:DNA-binding transcriptional MerR regulator